MLAFRVLSTLRPLCCAAALLALAAGIRADSVSFAMRHIAGAQVYVITADLNDPRVYVDITIPARGLYHSESFARLVQHDRPVAAVTGTYFDTRTLLPVGSLVTGGRKLFEGGIGAAVCFVRPGGQVQCAAGSPEAGVAAAPPVPLTVRVLDKRKGEACDWTGVDCGLRAGPRLLANGRFVLNARREGFRHPGLFGRRTRMALGVTAANKLLLVAVRTPATFARTATIMKSLGAAEAICLDGGSSSAMYYRGKFVAWPGRALTNIIEVHMRQEPAGPVAMAPAEAQQNPGQPAALGSGRRPVERQQVISPEREQSAVMLHPLGLGLAKGRRALFPVHRA